MDQDGPPSTQEPLKVYITYKYPAKNVLIAGTFTEWTSVPMRHIQDDLWYHPLQLPPGNYQYKFIVDGFVGAYSHPFLFHGPVSTSGILDVGDRSTAPHATSLPVPRTGPVSAIWCMCLEKPDVLLEDNIRNNLLCVKEKTLVIIRGASGSGKTTLAKKLLEAHGGITFAEADKWMLNDNGQYVFDPKKLSTAHSGSVNDVLEAMEREDGYIVVSNTSVLYWEMYNYVKLALNYGYKMKFLEPDTEWRYNVKSLITKNSHNVPNASIKHQLDNLRHNPTLPKTKMIERILATGGRRPTNYRKGFQKTRNLYFYGLGGNEIYPYIKKLKVHLGDITYALYVNNLQDRDGGKTVFGETMYHITLSGFQPKDEEVLSEEQSAVYFKKLVDLESKPRWVGIGEVEDEGNKAYFLVVDWPEVNDIRTELQLKPLDLHVTLGFDPKDVHTVPKTEDTVFLR